MKTDWNTSAKQLGWSVVLAGWSLGAAEKPLPVVAPATEPDRREELREKWKNLSPEERENAKKQWVAQNPGADKKRDEFRQLTPEQQEARIKEMRTKMETALTELRKKQTDGTLTPEEEKRLKRMEEMLKRIEQRRAEQEQKKESPDKKCDDQPKTK
jgi:hypothetical protein